MICKKIFSLKMLQLSIQDLYRLKERHVQQKIKLEEQMNY